ncbi:MAG: hypothetical protein B1H40_02060, partial [Candidatus Latescibacteria bacterium 4484_181]
MRILGKAGFVQRYNYGKLSTVIDIPDLLEVTIKSFQNFLQADVPPEKRARQGIQAVFMDIFPITDVHNLFSLEFLGYSIGKPKYSIFECQERNLTYAAPLKARLRLDIRERRQMQFKEGIEQTVFLGELPLMTDKGSFIINGAERVIVAQLHRSPGVFFDEVTHPSGRRLYSARIIPYRGSWVSLKTDINDTVCVYIDQTKKVYVTVLLRALGFSDDEQILDLFRNKKGVELIENTLAKDAINNQEEAWYAIYSLMRPGEAPNVQTAREFFHNLFFNPKRYNLGKVGRYRINQRLGLDVPSDTTVLTPEDFVKITESLLALSEGEGYIDDIDHLGNRRVRLVEELLSEQLNIAFSRMARVIREKVN